MDFKGETGKYGGTPIKDTKDVIIQQLKREVTELRRNQQNFEEMMSKIEQLEHLNNMISQEKLDVEVKAREKNNGQLKVIAELRSELETLKLKLSEYSYEVENLTRQNEWFEEVSARRKSRLSKKAIFFVFFQRSSSSY